MYVPAANCDGSALTRSDTGSAPLAGLTLSHGVLIEVVYARPPTEELGWAVTGGDAALPAGAAKFEIQGE